MSCNWRPQRNCKFKHFLEAFPRADVQRDSQFPFRHSRDWRYHTEEKVWIMRVPGMQHYEKIGQSERGTFYYFDALNWRRVPKDFQIDTSKLEKCPNLNAYVNLTGQPV